MNLKNTYNILINFLIIFSFVSGDENKGSLVFVIDDTFSMNPEITSVKEKTDEIFDAVLNSNASQIDEFIIVTFNDPDAYFIVKTNIRHEFRSALNSIVPHGGDDCPEMAMAGIELALYESKPNSFLYVYTDASASDYLNYETVKSLAQQKSIQINYLLTGECEDPIEELHTVYDRLAADTYGQVLHIGKFEISKIIDYILANLRNKRIILLRKTYKNKCDTLKFTIDSKVWEILISLTSPRPLGYKDPIVYSPNGNEIPIEGFINSQNTSIYKMQGEPGEYSIAIEKPCEEITVVISASTSVSFRHGFSSAKASSIDETSTKPVSGKKSHLAIALTNEAKDVTLKSVEIRDMNDNLIPPLLSLKLEDDERQFYMTDLFAPPQKTFTIAVIGYTKSNEKITRVSQTSIDYHKPIPGVPIKNMPATVHIIGPKEVSVAYLASISIKCKVNGFPKPQIWWEEGHIDLIPAAATPVQPFMKLTATVVTEIAPNEYITTIDIKKVTNNLKFFCKASNFVENSDYVMVTIENRPFLNILTFPKDTSVEFGDSVKLNIKIDAHPPATISWYYEDKEISNNVFMEIITFSEGSSLIINSANPSLTGKYSVVASNGYNKKEFKFKITVTIKEKAAMVSILGKNEITVNEEQPITLNCKIEGFPKPSITWEDQYHNVLPSQVNEKSLPYEYLSTLHIDKLTESGTYTCKAKNFKEDSGLVKVTVMKKIFFNILEYPKDTSVEFEDSVELKIKIDANPPATINWYHEDKEINNNVFMEILTSSEGSSLIIKSANPSLTGKYSVVASSGSNKQEFKFKITVTIKEKAATVSILAKNEITVNEDQPITLNCKIEGFPKPSITWEDQYHNVLPSQINEKKLPYEYLSTLHIDKLTESGTYTCKAKNFKEDSGLVKVTVMKKNFFNILEYPKDTSVEFEDSVELKIKIDANPPATINWYHEDKEINNNVFMEILKFSEGSSLIIKSANPSLTGKYSVVASSGSNKQEFKFKITVTIKEKAAMVSILDKNEITVNEDQPITLNCKIEGFPKPSITWEDQYHNVLPSQVNEKSLPYEYLSTLHIDKLTESGTYTCKAKNFKEDSGLVKVTVMKRKFFNVLEYPKDVAVKYGKSVNLNMKIYAKPVAKIIWYKDGKEIKNDHDFQMSLDRSVLKIISARTRFQGKYNVKAYNGEKQVEYEFHVTVTGTVPPTVKINPSKSHDSKNGERIKLTCEVDGIPTPDVYWLLNGVEIYSDQKYKIYGDHTLSFTGSILDSGNYACKASNYLKTVSAEVSVFIYEPAKIEPPVESKFDVKLRSKLILSCKPSGYPKPKVQWLHNSIVTNMVTKISSDSNYNVVLDKIQIEHGGIYHCTADNFYDTDVITYTVNVQAPIIITNPGIKDIYAIEGDLSFTLPCNAIGSPKPTITWEHNGITITSGGSFKITNEGNLIVYNIVSRHEGTYTCVAYNGHNKDTINYDVYVHAIPPMKQNSLIIPIKEGAKNYKLSCGMAVKQNFLVRWFKDGVLKTAGILNLILIEVTKADAGYYICRLTTPEQSYSFHKRVFVGTKPKFVNTQSPTIVYNDGVEAMLDCSAIGDPPPKITWWYDYSYNKIDVDTSQYTFKMNADNIGPYRCYASNELGTIKRIFEIIAGECVMSLENDFTPRQPILVTGKRKRQWPIFMVSRGTLRMQKQREFTLFCPDSILTVGKLKYGRQIKTSCVGDSMLKVFGRTVKASEIVCDEPIVPLAQNLSTQCMGRNTERFLVGFDIDRSFLQVFSVCYDKTKNTTIFIQHDIHKAIANAVPKDVPLYTRGTFLSYEFEEIYDCGNQKKAISLFGKSVDKNCCFKRRQLVNPMDVLPGMAQVATFHYFNVVPQWSSCGSVNWEEVELRVRQYALNSDSTIQIWTGAAYSVRNHFNVVKLKDSLGQELEVPHLIWKVIKKEELAIIYINVPGLSQAEVSSYILCPDICESKDWMRNPQWHDVDKGYIYCCTIQEFERTILKHSNVFDKRIK